MGRPSHRKIAAVAAVAAVAAAMSCLLASTSALADAPTATSASSESPRPAPASAAAASAQPVRGPAQNVVLTAEVGYGVGALSAIRGAGPKVVHGTSFHFGLGWAWAIRQSHALGLEAFAEGMLDGNDTTRSGMEVGGRYGASAFVLGERVHVRAGAGYARTRSDARDYDGIGVTFAAGFHVPITPELLGKKAAFVAEFVPSWDFLSAGDETLHRWGVAALLGLALY